MTTMLGVSLSDRTVVLVGGGRVAARRIPRLIADGARIRVVAPQLDDGTRELVARHGLEWRVRAFHGTDLDDAWLVHTATGDPEVDGLVARLCEQRRIFCINAADGTRGSARLTAQTVSGDVVVGVAGDVGVDPRRAARVRDAVAGLLAAGRLPVRGRRAGGVPPAAAPAGRADGAVQRDAGHAARRTGAPGRVDLVGGGPGPIDLMTVRARRLLAEADVVVADRLGPAAHLLDELDPEVLVIDVGKRPDHHPVPQHEINALLIAHAAAGRRVVRLKGGDPFVYGRGGEEVLACRAAGIAVDVTPGPSSVMSVPQAAGIPVTHRGTASAVHVISGQGGITATALQAMQDDDVTTVILMGVAALPRIVHAARDAGVPDDRPVAIIENGHTPQQRTTHSSLGAIVADAAAIGVRNPAVIVIGEVARAGLLLPVAEQQQAALRTGESTA